MLATFRSVKQNYMALFDHSAFSNSSSSSNSPTLALYLEHLDHLLEPNHHKHLNP